VSGPRFGEQGGLLTYGEYLHLTDLLGQQVPESDPPAHDELLFITIHQVYELWFKLLLAELTDARDRMLADVMVAQVATLETISPGGFAALRRTLASSSGLQSVQFREIEFLSGLRDPLYLQRFRGLTEVERARLQRRLAEPSLWDGYLSLLRHNGFRVDSPDVRFEAYRVIAGDRERYGQLWDLAEALVDHDQNWSLWRARHVLMAERQIGTKPGTGGSAGGAYLRSRIELRFYPELWELRSRL